MGWGSGTANVSTVYSRAQTTLHLPTPPTQFPYLIDPLSAIQNYVNSKNPTIPIEAVLSDFNLPQVTKVAGQADVCLVFVNADSGEGKPRTVSPFPPD